MEPCSAYGKVIANTPLSETIYELKLEFEQPLDFVPGQFVNVKIPGFYLRRPISVADYQANTLTLLYKTIGEGTEKLSMVKPGTLIDTLMPLGNGFDLSKPIDTVIAGGMGIAPIYQLTKTLVQRNHKVQVIIGVRNQHELIYLDQFKALNVPLIITSDDGSIGIAGTVLDGIKTLVRPIGAWAACGPKGMMAALSTTLQSNGQVSLECRMGCGFGACMGCSIETTNGTKRVCSEGPVFDSREVIWESLK